ncbi:hypothetical protein II7_05384 [Bacillus cereus MSX-A12]|uniref:hypothetical protein n=1 Tax=Bacillus paranthracis TaxID=2026186 RepID=UPI00027969C1|nr:hypothetical protein II7_05384 [Bacillus cereus MSX-A12]
MFKKVKEWLFEYTFTKYLVQLNKQKYNSHVPLDSLQQLKIIKLLKYLGVQDCELEIYQKPQKESYNLKMSDLQITNTSITVNLEKKRTFELNYKIDGGSTILLSDDSTMVFELSDSTFNIKLTVLLPFTIEHLIEESKRLSKERQDPFNYNE